MTRRDGDRRRDESVLFTLFLLFKNRVVQPDGKIGIISGCGSSRLTLDDITYDHAGKYEVSVENTLGKERRFFSLAVEGKSSRRVRIPAHSPGFVYSWKKLRCSPSDGGEGRVEEETRSVTRRFSVRPRLN